MRIGERAAAADDSHRDAAHAASLVKACAAANRQRPCSAMPRAGRTHPLATLVSPTPMPEARMANALQYSSGPFVAAFPSGALTCS